MTVRAVLRVVILQRQHHRRAPSFGGELPGHSTLILRPYPPPFALRSSPEPRNLNRLEGVATYNGLPMG